MGNKAPLDDAGETHGICPKCIAKLEKEELNKMKNDSLISFLWHHAYTIIPAAAVLLVLWLLVAGMIADNAGYALVFLALYIYGLVILTVLAADLMRIEL
jgi:hypothetical protein